VIRDRRRDVVTVVLAVLGALGFLFGLLLWSGNERLGSSYTVSALVPNAGSMGPGATIRIAGLSVGKVESVKRNGPSAVLELRFDKGPQPLPSDTRVAVRLRSLIGENYVEVTPGVAKTTIADGASIPIRQTEDFVDVDEILTSLDGETRDHARQLIQGLGKGVDGRGEKLNALVGGVAGVITDIAPTTAVINRDREQLAHLVDDLGSVMRAVGDRGEATRKFAAGGRRTFEAVASRDAALRRLLRELPSTLQQARSTAGKVERVSDGGTAVVANLAKAVTELQPTIAALRPAAQDGRELLRELGDAAPKLRGTLANLERLSGPALTALPQVEALLCEANPAVKYLAPYARELQTLIGNMGSATNYYDATGHAGRLYAMVGETSLTAQTPELLRGFELLRQAGLLNPVTQIGYNAYPKPGQAGSTIVGRGLRSYRDVKEPYPRVEAEC
jgi:phospholipid/cholesterol/gamma-HCH transport system substrate-binding protein